MAAARHASADARREDRLRRQRWRGADALLFQHQPRRRRRQEQQLPEILRNARPGDSFIKSASYLLHSRRLQQGARLPAGQQRGDRAGRLRHPAALLRPQEMAPAAVRPLCRPDRIFPGRYQHEYAALFRKRRPIDFGIGYRWRPHASNLLLAVKKPAEAGAEASGATSSEEQKAENTATQSAEPPRQRRRARQSYRSPFDFFRPR